MNGLGERLDAMAAAALGDFDPPSADAVVAAARTRRSRRRSLVAIGAIAVTIASVTVGLAATRGASTVRVTSNPVPGTAPDGPPPLAAIAEASTAADHRLHGPPEVLGQVVGTTTSIAEPLLDLRPTTTPRLPDTAVWWVLITRHACPPGCGNAAFVSTVYVSVLLRASDLSVLQVQPLGSEPRDLAVAGPVYPLVLPGQSLPSAQPALSGHVAVVPAATVEAADLKSEGCPVPAHLSGLRDALHPGPGPVRCTSITVRLYPNWAALDSSMPGLVEPGLAFSQPSRPLYYVTVWGQLPFVFTGAVANAHGAPTYEASNNGIYDAITGQGEGGGPGDPLP